MKTFIINSLKDAMDFNNKLDSIAMIQNKEWTVYTDEANITEKYIFLKKGSLVNSMNGVSKFYKWQYIAVNSSIIVETEASTLLFKVAFCDKNLLILNLDGTQEFCFLINHLQSGEKLLSYEDIQWYLIRNCNIDVLTEKQRLQYYEKKKREEEKRKLKLEEEQKEEDKALNTFLIISGILFVILIIIGLCYCK